MDHKRHIWLILAILAIALFAETASAGSTLNYTITVDPNSPGLFSLLSLEHGFDSSGEYYYFTGLGDFIAGTTTTVSHVLPFGSTPDGIMLFGFADGNCNPYAVNCDLTLGVNNTFANFAQGQDWSQLFATPEGLLATYLVTLAGNGIQNFFSVDAQAAQFTLGNFTLEQFSSGQIIGSGSASFSPVPEPGSLGLLAIGLGFFAFGLRRRLHLPTC
jgi:hypothetical protein